MCLLKPQFLPRITCFYTFHMLQLTVLEKFVRVEVVAYNKAIHMGEVRFYGIL